MVRTAGLDCCLRVVTGRGGADRDGFGRGAGCDLRPAQQPQHHVHRGRRLVITNTGTVTAGTFTGSTVVQVITGPAADVLLCTAGLGTVPGIYSVITLEITST